MNDVNIDELLAENEEHLKRVLPDYNPLTGEGSPIPRKLLRLRPDEYILIPEYMASSLYLQEVMSFPCAADFAVSRKIGWEIFLTSLTKLRIKWDFEFWAATCCNIKDKNRGKFVPFILRPAQLKLLRVLITDLFGNKPIRVILLKARQWGGSTLVQMFLAWIQIFHCENWNSVIIAHQKDAARNIRAMYSNMAAKHPASVANVRFRNFEGSSSNKQLVDNGSVISIGSMERPDALRSDDIKQAHLSEVGMWRQTKEKKPEDVIQAIVSSIPSDPFTTVVLESTAKGVGNYFHNTWCEAEAGLNAYTPVFVAWWEIEIYLKPFVSVERKIEFAKTLTDEELYRFGLGATLEGLFWYREKRREFSSDWQMRCEFPSTPQEAFVTTGRYAHNPRYIEQMRPFTKPPLYVGELYADAPYGKDAINESLSFAPLDNGDLWLWALPDKKKRYGNRYVVSFDIGGRTDGADWHVISVIDRLYLASGGIEECIGTCRFHLDQDLAVWRAVQVAKFFNNALLVVESNSLDRKGQEGDHSLTILDEIKDYYPNLYFRDDPQKIREGLPVKYGFHTNHASKTDLVNQMNKRFREVGHIEYDKRALDEAQYYEIKPDGTYGAISGKHDDIHLSRAIGLKASATMPVPALIADRSASKRDDDIVNTEAMI